MRNLCSMTIMSLHTAFGPDPEITDLNTHAIVDVRVEEIDGRRWIADE